MAERYPELNTLLRAENYRGLWSYLEANSNLPGPRANLNLILEFADAVRVNLTSAMLGNLNEWLATSVIDAPVNSPAEFPVACAAAGIASFVIGGDESIVPPLILAAHDDRWRTREGLVLGLQRAGERSSDPVVLLMTTWARSGDPFLERAAISVLANNPILKDRATALLAIDLSGEIIDRLQSIAPALRKTEGNRILQKALGFAISMFVAAAPDVGFEVMERWLINGDEVTRRIISENLGKARLSTGYPTEVARLKGVHFEIDDWER